MDIKLRARLSAYSKIESVSAASSIIPDPDVTAAGHVVGVNDNGKYTLFPKIETSDIDNLFQDASITQDVTKEEIDSLFDKDNAPTVYPTTDMSTMTVTKQEIDSLFE